MGLYTGIRFKGRVKEELREGFEIIALEGKWDEHWYEPCVEFGGKSRASFIPMGRLCYMPKEWHNDDLFDLAYNAPTGKWTFKCSLKNYDNTIEHFLELLPDIMESVGYLEIRPEDSETSSAYEMVDGVLRRWGS